MTSVHIAWKRKEEEEETSEGALNGELERSSRLQPSSKVRTEVFPFFLACFSLQPLLIYLKGM